MCGIFVVFEVIDFVGVLETRSDLYKKTLSGHLIFSLTMSNNLPQKFFIVKFRRSVLPEARIGMQSACNQSKFLETSSALYGVDLFLRH